MKKEDIALFMSIAQDLDKSYPTMHRYVKEGNYPADVCMDAERITNGRLRPVIMRPDLFLPTTAQMLLLTQSMKSISDGITEENIRLVISILNFFEDQQPDIYNQMLEQIQMVENGSNFIEQRIAHKQNEHN